MPKKKNSPGRPAVGHRERQLLLRLFKASKGEKSVRALARETGLSARTIGRILKSEGLQTKTKTTTNRRETPYTPKHITLQTVATEAGVSTSTASRALRDSPKISTATRKLVREAADKLGYTIHPHIGAAMTAIRAGKVRAVDEVVAYIFSDPFTNLSWKELYEIPWGPVRKFDAARAAAKQKGYQLEPYPLRQDETANRTLERVLKARGIRGLMIDVPAYYAVDSKFPFKEFHTVSFRELWKVRTHVVGHNHFFNMVMLFGQLWEMGYRRIGYVGSDAQSTSTLFRRDAGFHHAQYHLAPEELRIPILHHDTLAKSLEIYAVTGRWRPELNRAGELDWIKSKDWSIELGPKKDTTPDNAPHPSLYKEVLRPWVEQYQPEVIICEHKDMIRWLDGIGLNVPQDVSVVHGNLNAEVADWSGLRRADESLGETAIELLVREMNLATPTIPKHPVIQRLSAEWVEGETTTRVAKPLTPYKRYAREWIEKIHFSEVN